MDICFIFDIDGVITNPTTKIPNALILHFIAQKLQKKEYVAILTGRALPWVAEKIVRVLQTQLEDINRLDYLFLSCEKGTISATFENGIIKTAIDPAILIPQSVIDAIKAYVSEKKGIFFDADKQTMVSVEINGGQNLEEVAKQKETLHEFEEWAKQNILIQNTNLILESSPISADIQLKEISKKISAKKFLSFLQTKHVVAERFFVFGDTESDSNIAQEIFDNKYKVRFIYVGENSLTKTVSFEVQTVTGKTNDNAVEDYLQSFS